MWTQADRGVKHPIFYGHPKYMAPNHDSNDQGNYDHNNNNHDSKNNDNY